jgi:hypothetical protein
LEAEIRNGAVVRHVPAAMTQDKLYDEATEVTAKDGEVILDGPDAVDVKVTPEAAEQTADNLVEGAIKARGQRRLEDFPHKPK